MHDRSMIYHASIMIQGNPQPLQDLVLSFAGAWSRLEKRLDAHLSGARGISFAEYRLLRALADAPGGASSRVDLATAVNLTPSGVTRALRPLEKIGVVETVSSDRDARLALAKLTRAGRELVSDASGVVDDVMGALLGRVDHETATIAELVEELAR